MKAKNLKVCEKRCNECLFTKDRVVGSKRAKEVISQCLKEDKYFFCHKGTINGVDIVCAGFYERFFRDILSLRFATAFNIIDKVNPDDYEKDN